MMKKIFGLFFSISKPLLTSIECLLLLFRKNDLYNFSFNDIYLYWRERNVRLPRYSILNDDNSPTDIVTILVGGTRVFWPKSVDADDLPFLHHEVFDRYNVNPSSYDNPQISIHDRTWIIDGGSAEGYFSIFSYQKSINDPLILALEPLPIMQKPLQKTLSSLYGLNFKVLPYALSDTTGKLYFDFDRDHICDSKIKTSPNSQQPICDQIVSLNTIDRLCSDFCLGDGGLIKLDIEGYEMKALEGAKEILKSCKPRLAVAVYHDYENAILCSKIILEANPNYKIRLRGCYAYFKPARPYMLFAY